MASGVVGIQKITKAKLADSRSLRQTMTEAEELRWRHLRNRRCGGFKFRRQQIIEGFIADFYCEQAQLAVEVDGGIHNDSAVKLNDLHREKVFKSRGIQTLRFSNDEVEKLPEIVVFKIECVCRKYLKPSTLTLWELERKKHLYFKTDG
jgi:very-short-patch-repair endonuclease